jgi:hypothetical protein
MFYVQNNSVCLADYCDMFGCRIRDNLYKYDQEKGSKKRILTLERCSQEKVNMLRRDCASLVDRYYFCFHNILDQA